MIRAEVTLSPLSRRSKSRIRVDEPGAKGDGSTGVPALMACNPAGTKHSR